ncbi:MAG: energy-coupling factor transporter ATPase [Lachnospiraceae bacterium]|nr:energy-coupling factor transporter ATPase [Lachnospiraceae bacterium]
MPIIRASRLGYDYVKYTEENETPEKVNAIRGVDLTVEKGDFIAVLGHNGSGKSTLAKHMNALLVPTSGTMWIDGVNTAEEEDLWKVRQKAGMIFQNPDNQIIGTVVDEDVAFGPENLGVPTEDIWSRVDDALAKVGMLGFRDRSPNRLSGGQKQRVAIAGVVAMHPECIIMDEPTAMLDPNGRKEVLEVVRELNEKEGVTVILITHYMEEVVYADKVYVMDSGKVILNGTPREIFSQVDVLKKYRLSVPQVTELAYELKQAGADIPDGILTIDELVNALAPKEA